MSVFLILKNVVKKFYVFLAFVVISTTSNAQTNLIPNNSFETWTAGVADSWQTTATHFSKNFDFCVGFFLFQTINKIVIV